MAAEPKSQRRNLGRPGVDIDTVKIVSEYQARHIFLQIVKRAVVLLQRRAEIRIVVGFLVDCEKQVEAVQQEVATTAGWVENF